MNAGYCCECGYAVVWTHIDEVYVKGTDHVTIDSVATRMARKNKEGARSSLGMHTAFQLSL